MTQAKTNGKRLLVVLAHPDDETFICGGALAHCAAKGYQITFLCATKGEMGRRLGVPPVATRETLPVLREAELVEACEALGIQDLRFMGLRDKTLDYYDPAELASGIATVMKEVRPHVVITFHELLGGHPDHCAIGRATTLAYQTAGQGATLYHLMWRDHAAQLAAVGASPDRLTTVHIKGAAAAAKLRAFRAHRTQSQMIEWLWDDKKARRRLTGKEFFLQGNGPARPGETEFLTHS